MLKIDVCDNKGNIQLEGNKFDMLCELTDVVGAILSEKIFSPLDIKCFLKAVPKAVKIHNSKK